MAGCRCFRRSARSSGPRFVNLDRMDEVKVVGPNEKSGDWAVLANHQGRHYLVVGGLDSQEEAEEHLGRMLGLERRVWRVDGLTDSEPERERV